ncbi:MAG: dihydrolipoamide acetyltransferase family protein [Candidatus Dormibacteria bacterium]
MATTVAMPQLGESVTEGTLAKWLKQPGDPVARYESIAEVVTDKVNAEIPSPAEGTMGEHLVKEGTVVAVGESLCVIEGAATAGEAPAAPAAAPAPAEPTPVPVAVNTGTAATPASAPASNGNGTHAVIPEGMHLTPVVRMLAREHNVDLTRVQGTGFGGRVTKKDVLDFIEHERGGTAAPAVITASPVAAPVAQAPLSPSLHPAQHIPAGEGDVLVPLTNVRRAIADHMSRSWAVSPHAWFMMEVNMQTVWNLRERNKRSFKERYGVDLTFLPFVAKATLAGLRAFPSMNASWSDDGIVEHRNLHLGIAVALEDNLIVPVIRDADRLSIAGLATTMSDLAERARSNKLKIDEIQGGTFTLNNTGALGTVLAAPIINQPQAAILAMDRIVKRVVVEGDAMAIRPMMNLCISFDHRLNDGLVAARFLGSVKSHLESFSDAELQ